MALKFLAATDVTAGEWFTWREDDGQKLEVCVRRLPPAEAKRIEQKHFGKRRRIVYTDKGTTQDLDTVAQERSAHEKASYSMVDTRGFEIEASGEGAAQGLAGILGEKVEVGSVVKLDGRWSDALKDLVFAGLPDLPDWINEKARESAKRDAEEAEEAEGN